MAKAADDTVTGAVIKCDSCMEIAQAEALLEQVNRVLEQPEPVVVQAAAIETITTPCMQVFCALARALKIREQQIQWESPSERFIEVARLLGLQTELGLASRD